MGAQIDPNNPLYGGAGGAAAAAAPIEAPAAPAPKPDLDFDINQSSSAPAPSFDLDLDSQNKSGLASPADSGGLDFDIAPSSPNTIDEPSEAPKAEEKSNFDFDLSGLDFPSSTKTPEAEKTSMNQTAALDLADLSLDSPGGGDSEAVGTKLELAKAYLEIGDKDGAREILQEVAKEGSSAQKEEAKKLIASL
jgi:pilus assembly protein FimV